MLLTEKEIDDVLGDGPTGEEHGHSHICCSSTGAAGERGVAPRAATDAGETAPFVDEDAFDGRKDSLAAKKTGHHGDAGEPFSLVIPSNINTINVFNSRRSYASEASHRDSVPNFP